MKMRPLCRSGLRQVLGGGMTGPERGIVLFGRRARLERLWGYNVYSNDEV